MKNIDRIFSLLFAIFFSHSVNAQDWTAQSSGTTADLNAVQFLDTDNGYAGGAAGTVLKTTDGGTTWTNVSFNSTYPVADLFFISTTAGWAAVGDVNDSDNSGEIWFTHDGGSTWTQQNLNSTRARLGISFADADNGWACGARNGPLDISATTDGGNAYFEQSNGNIFGWTYGIDALNPATIVTVGGAFFPSISGLVIMSSDGGSTWTLANTGTVPFLYDIDFVDDDNLYATGDGGAILASTDGGSTWTAQASGTSEILWGISFSDAQTGMAAGENGAIVSTTDGGSTWTTEPSGTSLSLMDISVVNSTVAWAVGASGTILKKDLSTGVDQINALDFQTLVSPNPARTEVAFFVKSQYDYSNLTLIVYDIFGRELQRARGLFSNQNNVVDISHLSPGLYAFVFYEKQKRVSTGILSVSR